MNELLVTRNRSKINEKAKGLNANRPYLLHLDRTNREGVAALSGQITGAPTA
jgi:hypothetical protein